MELPTGTVSFLFTDVEGSTRLLRELGEAYRPVQDDEMRLMHEAIAEGGGTVIRTEGDAFFAVFPTATGAVLLAAVAFERREFDRGLRLLRFSDAIAERTGTTPPEELLGDNANSLTAARTSLDQGTIDRLRAEGRSMSVDEGIAYAMGES